MYNNNAISRNNALNEDIDDDLFLNNPTHGSSGYLLGNDSTNNEWQQRRRQLLEERHRIEQNTLESSRTAVGLVYESEKVGLNTAEELIRQREQLENTEEKLDSMNSMMRVSQKHLTSMKSIFGGLKNYFSRNSDSPSINSNSISARPALKNNSQLNSTVDKIKNETNDTNHPMLARRGIDTRGFTFDDDNDVKQEPTLNSSSQRTKQIERQIDNNLTEIDMGIGRLKHLALGLGDEIESQNSMLDRITSKAERAEDTIQYQNRQMKQILKK
jgi:synaptosomal-associated protein 29